MLRSFACPAIALLALIGFSRAQTIDNYLGKNASVPVAALGAHAQLFDRGFNPIASAGPHDVVVWQHPLPGDAFVAGTDAKFMVTDKVPVPEIVGMRVADAQMLLSYRGLSMSIVGKCGDPGSPPAEDQADSQVTEQCVAPGTLFDPGNFVGVVIGPWPESLTATTIVLIAIAALAAVTALIFFMRGRFLQEELDVFKSGGNSPKN